jgi:hypothetical protein
VAIILSPTIICISIYLTLKHICLSINPDLSRIKPRLYPWIFVPADISCLLIQAIGGSLAASAGYTNKKLLDGGNHAIIAGIVLQLVVLAFFGVTIVDYLVRVRKWFLAGNATPEALELWNDRKFRMFVFAVGGAYCCILIRCIYRYVKHFEILLTPCSLTSKVVLRRWQVDGETKSCRISRPSLCWKACMFSPVSDHSYCLLTRSNSMILIAVGLLAGFPPGILFPQITARSARLAQRKKEAEKQNDSNEMAVRSSGESPSATTETKPTV